MLRLRAMLRSATTRLASTYLLIVMVMSIGFSVVFYNASLQTLRRQVPPNGYFQNQRQNEQPPNDVRRFLNQRAAEGERDLLERLVMLNIVALLIGTAISYYLARRSLRPIEQAMDAQSRFVSDASHELRTPLTAMQASNEVALRSKKLTVDQAKIALSANVDEITKLKQLTDSLLDLARQDMAPVTLAAVDVQQSVHEAINAVIPLAVAKEIAIDDQTLPLHVKSTPAALRQILVILLDNAIKYSPEATTITIGTQQKGQQVVVIVTDQGPGIRASDQAHIFERFYRADSARSSGENHGYGLGLSIARLLADRHQARLEVSSILGKGSTFQITMRRDTTPDIK